MTKSSAQDQFHSARDEILSGLLVCVLNGITDVYNTAQYSPIETLLILRNSDG